MKNNCINLGLIGAGVWGSNYIKTVHNIEGIKIIAISTISGELKQHNFENDNYKIYKNWKDLFYKENIDGAIIATPASTHYEIAKYCIQLGLPCIVEKPIATELSKVQEIYELAKKNKAIILVNHIHLYHPAFNEIKKIAKEIKNIFSINAIAGRYGPFRKDIRALWDWGPHDIAMSIEIMGNKPKVIEASYLSQSNQIFSKGEIIQTKLLFDNEKIATLIFGNLMKNKIRNFDIKTEESIFRYQPLLDKKLLKLSFSDKFPKSETEIITSDISALENLLIKFRDLIQKKEENLNDVKLALIVTSVIESIENLLDKNN